MMIIIILLGVSSLAGLYRVLMGPSLTDRVIGLDLLFAIAIVFCLMAAWVSERAVYLDVSIGLALIGFVATLAWSSFIQSQAIQSNNREES